MGRVTAWWRTTAAVTAGPARFFERLGGEGRVLGPLLFALIGATLHQTGYALKTCLGSVLGMLGVFSLNMPGGNVDWQMFCFALGTQLAKLLVALLSPLVVLGLYLGVASGQHLALRLVDAGEERGISGTLQVACYAFAVGWVGLVPFLGPLAFAVWWTILMVVGTSRVHGRSTTRTLVVALPSLMLVAAPFAACLFGVLFAFLSPI